MEVRVTPETAKKLNDVATTTGRAPEEIVEDALAGYLEEMASVRKTLDSRYDDLKSGRGGRRLGLRRRVLYPLSYGRSRLTQPYQPPGVVAAVESTRKRNRLRRR